MVKLIALSLLALLVSGCLAPHQADDPCSGDAQSVLFAFVDDSVEGGEAQLFAADGCAWDGPLTLRADQDVVVLALPLELETYQISAGRLSTVSAGRPLPVPMAIRSLDRSTGQWTEQTELDPRVRSLRIPRFVPNACFVARRCPRSDEHRQALCESCQPESPIAAVLPELPRYTPCPGGWSEVAGGDGGPDFCDPPELPGPVACAPTEAQWFGAETCAPVGTACPVGEFAEDLPIGPVLYVRAGVPPGGDGSLADPLGTLSEAYAVAVPGTTIALSKGRHPIFDPRVPSGLTLIGACSAETELSNPAGVAFWVFEPAVEIRDLQILESESGVWAEGVAAAVHLEGVVISGGNSGLLALNGAQMNLVDVLTRDQAERGLYVTNQSKVSVRHSAFERSALAGVRVDASELDLEDVVLRDGQAVLPAGGVGLSAESGARVSAVRVLSERNFTHGIEISDSVADFQDLTVRGTRAEPSTSDVGQGLDVLSGTVTVERALIEDNRAQISAQGQSGRASHLQIDQLVVRDSAETDKTIRLEEGSSTVIRRARIEQVRKTGIALRGDAELQLSDVILRALSPEPDRVGLLVDEAGSLRGERILVERAASGVMLRGSQPTALSDLQIRQDPGLGRGIQIIEEGVGLTLERAMISGGARGIEGSSEGFEMTLSDLTVEGTNEVAVQVEGGDVVLDRAHFPNIGRTGLYLERSVARVHDLEIERVTSTGDEFCFSGSPAVGVCISGFSDVEISRFVLRHSEELGVALLATSGVQLVDGLITESTVGLDWPTDDTSLVESLQTVQIFGNQQNVRSP